jgi:hypothetical protein
MKLPGAATISVWTTILVTGLSPFGPALYDAFSEDDDSFLFEYRYDKNPVVEWNRQVNAALRRLDESVKNASDVPKSVVRALTKELAINTATLAAWADIKPFDSLQVRVTNISRRDLKDIRVQFHGCSGYDSHTTYPDALASQESAESLRKLADPITISYRKVARSTPDTSYNAYITFYGQDASQCRPQVSADLDNGKSAIGRFVNIDDYLQKRRDERQRLERITDITFKLGLLAFGIFLYFQLRSLKRRPGGTGA